MAMTMHVDLSPEMEDFIRSEVDGGFYGNADDVVRDGVARLQADRQRTEAWHAAIRVGMDELDAGRSHEYTPELMDDIMRQAVYEMHDGKPIDPDVLP
jgi:putative addiction module CopG family antidote